MQSDPAANHMRRLSALPNHTHTKTVHKLHSLHAALRPHLPIPSSLFTPFPDSADFAPSLNFARIDPSGQLLSDEQTKAGGWSLLSAAAAASVQLIVVPDNTASFHRMGLEAHAVCLAL